MPKPNKVDEKDEEVGDTKAFTSNGWHLGFSRVPPTQRPANRGRASEIFGRHQFVGHYN